ncbi:unnamed protein product, partial [Allacma fusca]
KRNGCSTSSQSTPEFDALET